MKRVEAVRRLSACMPEVRARFGVSELSVFGSVARDEAREDSDVDLMVTFDATPSFRLFMDLKDFLQTQLGARVDLVTRAGLKPRVRHYVEREALRVA